MLPRGLAIVAVLWAVGVDAHTVITYPGWRGNNLIQNETFPYGMQWSYPCEYLVLSNSPSFQIPMLLLLPLHPSK